ncbi:MAG TPA: ABC transporter permease [Rhizomicrobium sp.]|jgi:putative ABC transport system permease protein
MGILGNYLVTALRNFARHKLYSFINIVGLAVGLACAIFIILFIRDELSYDRWIPDTQNLYRVENTFYFPGQEPSVSGSTPFPVTIAMAAQIPEVAAQTHLIPERMTAKVGDRQFSEFVDVVDPNFFKVIELPLVEGDPATVFANPNSAVLSQEEAKKYFGSQDPVGKTITIDGTHPLTVTGVMRDLPHNTQLVGDIAVPNTSKADQLPQSEKKSWTNVDGEAFVRLVPGASPAAALAKMPAILDKNIDAKKEMSLDIPGSKVLQIYLTPFLDVHLKSRTDGGMTRTGSWTVIYGFGAIALLILLIACFNFTNLATARAMMRAREVSLRKVMGAKRKQLVAQFLGESVLTALLALALALAIVEVLLPAYDGFLNRPITLTYATSWPLLAGLVCVATVTGLIAGIYPALVLSGFRPASSLRAGVKGAAGSGALRTGLVILQFAISIGLGIAAIVVFAQIQYAQRFDLGFQRDRMVIVSGAETMTPATRDSFVHALQANPAVEGVVQSGPVPFVQDVTVETFTTPGASDKFLVRTIDAAPDYPKLYDMRLLTGRWLSWSRGNDLNTTKRQGLENGRNVLLTESAARRFGWTAANAIGRTLQQTDAGQPTAVTVVGVLADVVMDGLRSRVQPIIFYYNPNHIDTFSVRVKGGHTAEALATIDATWHRFAPTVAMRRRFLTDMFDRLLVADRQQGAMFGLFVGIAIFIACLGLFGLAAFTAERRTKEIGIRKTFGARTRDIVWLLLWQFSIPVVIANVIAWPIAWFYLHRWLESYAYRISLNPLYFALAGVTALAIAWVTVFAHALRVARSNPVHALRYE